MNFCICESFLELYSMQMQRMNAVQFDLRIFFHAYPEPADKRQNAVCAPWSCGEVGIDMEEAVVASCPELRGKGGGTRGLGLDPWAPPAENVLPPAP